MPSANEFLVALLGIQYFTSTYCLKIPRLGALLELVLLSSPGLPTITHFIYNIVPKTDLECLRCGYVCCRVIISDTGQR